MQTRYSMRNAVIAAMAFAGATCAVPAGAVMLSPNGVGQVLIYPYYTVRSAPGANAPYNSLLSVVNGSTRGKAIKVRFREALAGAPVLELSVFMSIRDVWTLAVVPTADGANALTTDTTCTLSARPASAASPTTFTFDASSYATDPLGADPGRVREGFVEVLEMGTVRAGSNLEHAVNHVAGKPPCNLGSDLAIATDLDPPSGQLYGSMTLVSVLDGTAYQYDAAALDYWSKAVQYAAPGITRPTLGDATPAQSAVPFAGTLYFSSWGAGVDAVNAVLAAGSTQAEFMREANVNGATDIVYTMPTKPLLVSATSAQAPFTEMLSANGACEVTTDYSHSREEQQYLPDQDQFNRPAYATMCWVTTVQSFNANWPSPSVVLGSIAGIRHVLGDMERFPAPTIYSSGLAGQSFVGPYTPLGRLLLNSAPTTGTNIGSGIGYFLSPHMVYRGLPVVGVTMMRYVNGVVPVAGGTTLSNYGGGSTVKTFADIGF